MRAMLLSRPGPLADGSLRLADAPDPVAAARELLLDVHACGVCRTDLQLATGDLAAHRLPIVPGHQAVGRVLALGDAGVTGWAIGDRAGVVWLAEACGHCRFCISGRENLCQAARFTGWDRDGGYANRMTVRADFAVRLPEGFDDVAGAPLLCGGVIGYRALKIAGVQPGSRVGLYGFGAPATLAIQVARSSGAEVYVASRSAGDLARAEDLGAVWTGGYDDRPPVPLDAAVTFAPVGSVVVAALAALDRGATLAINAIHLDRIPEFPYDLLWWERSIRSVANVTRQDAQEFLALAAAIPIQTQVELFRLADGLKALSRLERGRIDGAAVLTMPDALP